MKLASTMWKLIVPLIVMGLSVTSFASEELLMGVMGDSISAGTLSAFPLRRCPNDLDHDCTPTPDSSISSEVDAKLIFQNREKLSWASGKEIASHYRLLATSLVRAGEDRPLRVLNVATQGNRTKDLPIQAIRIADAMRSGNYAALKYLTLLIGANDACDPKPTALETMRINLLQAFFIISSIQQAEPIRIFVAGMPRIADLGRPEIRKTRTPFLGLKCAPLRNHFFKACKGLLKWKTPEEYAVRAIIVEERNRLLRSVAMEAGALFPNLKVAYSDKLFEATIDIPMLAIDCFHPSRHGQEVISALLWKGQPWY